MLCPMVVREREVERERERERERGGLYPAASTRRPRTTLQEPVSLSLRCVLSFQPEGHGRWCLAGGSVLSIMCRFVPDMAQSGQRLGHRIFGVSAHWLLWLE